jgi:hypothetical protein
MESAKNLSQEKAGHRSVNRPALVIGMILGGLLLLYFGVWQQEALLLRQDSYGYIEVAKDLSDGSLDEIHNRTIGYSILPLLTGITDDTSSTVALFGLQLMMHFGAVAFAAYTLRALRVNYLPAIAVLIVLGVEPLIVGAAGLLMSETFTIFLLVIGTGSLLLYLSGRSVLFAVLSALCLGYVGIVRPTFQLQTVVTGGILALAALTAPTLRRRSIIAAALNVALAVLFVGGLMVYNRQTFGFSGLTPLAGYNLATRTSHALELIPDKYAEAREIMIRYRNETVSTEPHQTNPIGYTRYIWAAVPELKQTLGMNDLELAEFLTSINADLIRRAPNLYMEEVSIAVGNYIQPFSPGRELVSGVTLLLMSAFHLAKMIFLLAMIGLALGGLLVYLTAGKSVRGFVSARLSDYDRVKFIGIALWVMLSIYNMVISVAMDVGSPRQRLPTDILLIMAAVVALDYLFRSRESLPILLRRVQGSPA